MRCVAASLVLFAVACSSEDPGPTRSPGLRALETTIFAPSCALNDSCHRGSAPQAGLNLEAPVHGKIVRRPSMTIPTRVLVQPGDPSASYLYQKISENTPFRGEQMPPGQPLSADAIARVRAWIEDGAKND